MDYSITLDWLAFTFREDTHEQWQWLATYASSDDSGTERATNGYKLAARSKTGIIHMWHPDRPEMGRHVVISGSALRDLLKIHDLSQRALLAEVVNAGGSITRLDLAKDAKNEGINLDAIFQQMDAGKSTGTARTFTQLHSVGGGNTIYVGSRQSEKFIRIYDKAAQTGAEGALWYRYELETKGMVARALATLLCTSDAWVNAFDAMASGMVDLPQSKDYRKFFLPGVVPIGIPKLEKKSDREKWIEEQVLPAVLKHYTEHRDSPAINKLRSMLILIDTRSDQ